MENHSNWLLLFLFPSIRFSLKTSTQPKSTSQLSLWASQENTVRKWNYATKRSTFCLVSERWVCVRASKHCQEKSIVSLIHFASRFLSRFRGVCHTRHVHQKPLERERETVETKKMHQPFCCLMQNAHISSFGHRNHLSIFVSSEAKTHTCLACPHSHKQLSEFVRTFDDSANSRKRFLFIGCNQISTFWLWN